MKCEFTSKNIPIPCMKRAKHSLLVRGNIAGDYYKKKERYCDEHFYRMRDGDLQSSNTITDTNTVEMESKNVKILRSKTTGWSCRFIFRENRL